MYRYRTQRKRSGGTRVLAEPTLELANRQREVLAHILEPAMAAEIGEHAHGFVSGRSIVTNAAPHAGKALVVKLDLRGFYPSVTERRVLGIFRRLGQSPRAARQLARFCTEPRTRALPQGAPTSPALSNLIARSLDRRLAALAARLGWTYTRYADDLTFSRGEAGELAELFAGARRIVSSEGFALSPKKTRVLRSSARQTVTGVVVNEVPTLPREDIRRLRAILHQAEHTGLAAQNREGIDRWEEHLRGKLALFHMLNPGKAAPLVKAFEDLVRRCP